MICPSCGNELSKVWQPQQAANSIPIARVQWHCGTCGGTFTREQLRPPPKRHSHALAGEPSLP
jgi:transcriptional regulator NrdR family protein